MPDLEGTYRVCGFFCCALSVLNYCSYASMSCKFGLWGGLASSDSLTPRSSAVTKCARCRMFSDKELVQLTHCRNCSGPYASIRDRISTDFFLVPLPGLLPARIRGQPSCLKQHDTKAYGSWPDPK